MVEHDELMRQAVAGLRASRSPTAGAEARVFAALELQLGGPPGFDPGGGAGSGGSGGASVGGSAAPVTVGWVAKVVGATASLAAGGLLLVQVGAGVVRTNARTEQRVGLEVAAAELEPADTVAGDPSVVAAEDDEIAAITVYRGALAKRRAVAQPAAVESVDPLAAELALIGAAQRASSPKAALELLDQHAREHPSGTMASEREALAVVALCQLDRTEDARTRARSLIAKRPGLPLLQSMRSECPVLKDLLRQTKP
jgi:hypothetical protein